MDTQIACTAHHLAEGRESRKDHVEGIGEPLIERTQTPKHASSLQPETFSVQPWILGGVLEQYVPAGTAA